MRWKNEIKAVKRITKTEHTKKYIKFSLKERRDTRNKGKMRKNTQEGSKNKYTFE